MKILFDHQRFSSQRVGGVTRYFSELATGLSAIDGVDVEVFAPLHVNEHLAAAGGVAVHGRKIDVPRHTGLPLRMLNDALSWRALRRRRDVDVFHSTYYSRIDISPRSAARIVTVFDMIHELHPDGFPRLDRTRAIKAIAVRRAHHVICISESTREDLLRLLEVPREKTSVVYLASALDGASALERASDRAAPYVLYVGARGGYKNFRRLLEAFARSRLPREGFQLACFGGGAFSIAERTAIARLGVGDSVLTMNGDDRRLAAAYRDAAMLAYPSLCEGFGLPVLEAMATGCPVACSGTSSLPEVGGDAAHYFDPHDVDAIVSALERVAFDRALASRMSMLGKAQAGRFSWSRCAQETFDIYGRVLAASAAAARP